MEQPPPAAEQSGTGRFLGWFPAPRRLPKGLALRPEPGTRVWDGMKGHRVLLNPTSDPAVSVKRGTEGKIAFLQVSVGFGGEGE